MRVLFSTTAGTGHFGPMVPFAKAGDSEVGGDQAYKAGAQRVDDAMAERPDVASSVTFLEQLAN